MKKYTLEIRLEVLAHEEREVLNQAAEFIQAILEKREAKAKNYCQGEVKLWVDEQDIIEH